MTTNEITKLELGTKVYLIRNARIEQYTTLSFSPKKPVYFYLISGLNVTETKCLYLSNDNDLHWEIDYEKAKEVMWEQLVENVKSINDTYFNGQKSLNFK